MKKAMSELDADALREVLSYGVIDRSDVRVPFITCVQNEHLDCLQAFMDAPFKHNLNLFRFDDNAYPMIWAVRQEKVDLVRVLASKRMDPKVARDIREHGRSPQHLAAMANNTELLKALLEGGWDPNAGRVTRLLLFITV